LLIDLARARLETPGCGHVLHFNNAGAALMPTPVIAAVEAHLDLESKIGGYEAADAASGQLEEAYEAVAELLGSDAEQVAMFESATRAWQMAFYSLRLGPGDRILTANGQTFSPIESFAGRAGKPVKLEVQRSRGAAPISVVVTPQSTRPHEELRQATADSWHILPHKGRRIAYIHMWSWATIEFQKVLLDSIIKSNTEGVDGFILDIRDGWGGAHLNYLGVFWRDVPLLERISREGKKGPFDTQIRKPAVLLVNEGTRSGKETIAYGAKKHRLARLVGERTAGAVVAGGPICLSDGSLLMLAQSEGRVDGVRLEGVGVSPDIEVPFDFRYAAGNDPQLTRALDVLTGQK